MSIKVFIDPVYRRVDKGDGGIRRVTEAQVKHLPDYGVEIAPDPEHADVIANHGAASSAAPGVPEVAHCHGLYWSRYDWPAWGHDVNARVVATLSRAVAHTAPSEWVARAMTRGMFVYPEVVYHGIDTDEWTPGEHGGYVLWNKARKDLVSDPGDMNAAAQLMPGTQFVSTFGVSAGNVKITGAMDIGRMRAMVRSAGVYLATTRETFGIGTLEALACGVPVAGWDWGGQSEIIVQGETGYLAPPGDVYALRECIARCIAERKRLSEAARADAVARWGWPQRIAQYAAIYKRVAEEWQAPRPRVSVLVTCHNLARFLPDCLASVMASTLQDWECIVIDDASSDNTPAVALDWHGRDNRIRYERTPENLKLPGALNYGAARARGRYLLPLDADNLIDPLALETLSRALDADQSIHIAYGHLDIMQGDGKRYRENAWPPAQYDWRAQVGHLNHLPSTSMLRREVWERSGGWRVRQQRAEDAEFWTRVTSLGFRARKVTDATTFTYRNRPDSKSKAEQADGIRDGNWCAWFPWSYAGDPATGSRLYNAGKGPRLDLVPWGAQALPPGGGFWPVPDYERPTVSVIIPVGPGHARYLIDALDSLVAQSFGDWEVIVVFDDGTRPERIAGAPYARVASTGGERKGPGVARNIGAKMARGRLLYFLDSDDYLLPWSLEKLVAAWRATVTDEYPGDIIYAGWLRCDGDGSPLRSYEADDFECGAVLKQMQHSVNVLIPRSVHAKIGGFDESMAGWEDWDYFIAAQAAGMCSTRINEPLFVYRFRAGHRREESFGKGADLKAYIREKWHRYYSGGDKLMCGCKKNKATAVLNANQPAPVAAAAVARESTDRQSFARALSMAKPAAAQAEAMKLRYQGPVQTYHLRGPATQKVYKFDHTQHREKWVAFKDGEAFLEMSSRGTPLFTRIDAPAIAAPAREPAHAPAVQEYTQEAVAPEKQSEVWDAMPGPVPVPAPVPEAAPEPEPEPPAAQDAGGWEITAPLPVVPDITAMTVTEARKLVGTADARALGIWLVQERAGQNRQTLTRMIERALRALEAEQVVAA